MHLKKKTDRYIQYIMKLFLKIRRKVREEPHKKNQKNIPDRSRRSSWNNKQKNKLYVLKKE